MYFFWKKLCCFIDFIYLCSRNACPCEGGYVKTYIDGTRPPAICTASLEGRFRTLLSVRSNLANLNLDTAVMQQKRLRGLILYLPAAIIPLYIYIIRCTPYKGARSLHIYAKEGVRGFINPWFRHSGNDHAVVYVYISLGVGRLNVAYPSLGAMRRPDCWDRRGEKHYSHVFFVSRRLVSK